MTVTPSRPAPLATAGAPAPRAKVSATRHETHGVVRVDDYHWLRDRGDPAVTAYLEAENAYTRAVMAPTEALQETLFAEIKGRIRQTDMSVPYREGGAPLLHALRGRARVPHPLPAAAGRAGAG